MRIASLHELIGSVGKAHHRGTEGTGHGGGTDTGDFGARSRHQQVVVVRVRGALPDPITSVLPPCPLCLCGERYVLVEISAPTRHDQPRRERRGLIPRSTSPGEGRGSGRGQGHGPDASPPASAVIATERTAGSRELTSRSSASTAESPIGAERADERRSAPRARSRAGTRLDGAGGVAVLDLVEAQAAESRTSRSLSPSRATSGCGALDGSQLPMAQAASSRVAASGLLSRPTSASVAPASPASPSAHVAVARTFGSLSVTQRLRQRGAGSGLVVGVGERPRRHLAHGRVAVAADRLQSAPRRPCGRRRSRSAPTRRSGAPTRSISVRSSLASIWARCRAAARGRGGDPGVRAGRRATLAPSCAEERASPAVGHRHLVPSDGVPRPRSTDRVRGRPAVTSHVHARRDGSARARLGRAVLARRRCRRADRPGPASRARPPAPAVCSRLGAATAKLRIEDGEHASLELLAGAPWRARRRASRGRARRSRCPAGARRSRSARAPHDQRQVVARALALGAQLPRGGPHQRVEPVERAGDAAERVADAGRAGARAPSSWISTARAPLERSTRRSRPGARWSAETRPARERHLRVVAAQQPRRGVELEAVGDLVQRGLPVGIVERPRACARCGCTDDTPHAEPSDERDTPRRAQTRAAIAAEPGHLPGRASDGAERRRGSAGDGRRAAPRAGGAVARTPACE